MAKLSLYKRVRNKDLNDFVAHMPGVRATLEAHQLDVAVTAEQILAQHREDGHARIELSSGKLDRYVVLSDKRGQQAAGAIEFGRSDYKMEVWNHKTKEWMTVIRGGSEGIYVLHRAAGLKARPPRGRLKKTRLL